LVIFWLVLYGYPLFKVYEKDGLTGVWSVVSLLRKGKNEQSDNI